MIKELRLDAIGSQAIGLTQEERGADERRDASATWQVGDFAQQLARGDEPADAASEQRSARHGIDRACEQVRDGFVRSAARAG